MEILKTIIGWLLILLLVFFLGFGKLGDEYVILLKKQPSWRGTFFIIDMTASNNIFGMMSNQKIFYNFTSHYSKIIFAIGKNGIMFMENLH
jgi:hypothetical protein